MDITEAREIFDNSTDKQVWSEDEVKVFVQAVWLLQQETLDGVTWNEAIK